MYWFQFQVYYAAFWKDAGPVMSGKHMERIEQVGADAVDYSVSSGTFLATLRKYHKQSVEDDDEDEDDPASAPTMDGAGEDDSEQAADDEYENLRVVGVQFAGSEIIEAEEAKNVTFPDQLATDGPLGVREWFGIGLAGVVVLMSSLLSGSAYFLKRRYVAQHTWGTHCLTEQGVGELLQIGWRYDTATGLAPTVATSSQVGGSGLTSNGGMENDSHFSSPRIGAGDSGTRKQYGSAAANAATNSDGGQQIFLQVYDKSKLGYNDDNSMLMGGIEKVMPEITATTAVPSSTNSTATPGQSSYQSGQDSYQSR